MKGILSGRRENRYDSFPLWIIILSYDHPFRESWSNIPNALSSSGDIFEKRSSINFVTGKICRA
jgi:hypothetical protein